MREPAHTHTRAYTELGRARPRIQTDTNERENRKEKIRRKGKKEREEMRERGEVWIEGGRKNERKGE